MSTRDPKPATLLAAVLATEAAYGSPAHLIARDAETIVRLGKRAARIAEQRCNGIPRYDSAARQMLATWTEQDEDRADKAVASIAKQATAILNPYGATGIKTSGDPRGFCLTFRLRSGRSNSFGGDVWGV